MVFHTVSKWNSPRFAVVPRTRWSCDEAMMTAAALTKPMIAVPDRRLTRIPSLRRPRHKRMAPTSTASVIE